MASPHLSKGWDILIFFGVPFIALLVFGFFRLDTDFTNANQQAPEAPEAKAHRQPQRTSPLSDPDGRPWDGDK